MRYVAFFLAAACAAKPLPPPEPVAPPKYPAPADLLTPPADAERRASGLVSKVLKPGTGEERPWSRDRVTVHYIGWTADGRCFDNSFDRDQPITFALTDVIAGWSEGVQQMVEGEVRRLWIPEALAYQGKSPKGPLVFDVTLIKIR